MIAELLAAGSLAAVVVLSIMLTLARRRVLRVERRLAALRTDLTALQHEVTHAGADSRTTLVTARGAAAAAGVEAPPPRLALEPVTGPVVKAVAIGAGARKAFARLAGARDRRGA